MTDGTSAHKRPNKASGISLVFLGSFNPAIFQPAWFMRYGLIPDVPEAADVEAITPQVTAFASEWLKVIVQPEKCELHATDEMPSTKSLQDLALSIFDLLPHTPITAMGINRHVHFGVDSEEAYTSLGFKLFSTAPWEGLLRDPRMRTVQVEDRERGSKSALSVTVQPSSMFSQTVFVNINDHHAIDDDAADPQAALELLVGVFDESLERSAQIIERVRSL